LNSNAYQSRVELGLLILIAVVCAGLSILQYRWTGELSRAEQSRLRSGLSEQLTRLARAFDDELAENCRALVPDPLRPPRDDGDMRSLFQSRYQEWSSSYDTGLFTRIAIAWRGTGEQLLLFEFDRKGSLAPQTQWPTHWENYRTTMTARMHSDGPPPYTLPLSTLVEMPLVSREGERSRQRSGELGWMIFEVNQEHLRREVLPRLMDQYLNGGADASYDASVRWAADLTSPVVYATRTGNDGAAHPPDATVGIFSIHLTAPPGGRERHRRPRPPRGRGEPPPRWLLEVRHRTGSLDAAVSQSRTRNFAMSFVLIALLGGAAWALVRYTARSRRLAEEQFRFAAGVSHDLRTPLTAIRGAAFNLAGGVISEPSGVERYAMLILRNANELTSMIENVLAFSASRGSHKRSSAPAEEFSVNDILERAVEAVSGEAREAGCRIDVSLAAGLPALKGDALAMELAVRNLVLNAARHAASGGWIGISSSLASGESVLEISVADRGPGIPESERSRIFEPFYRGSGALSSQTRGTGLGLALVRETVEAHHGEVTVRESPGGGAEFVVRLPLPGTPENRH